MACLSIVSLLLKTADLCKQYFYFFTVATPLQPYRDLYCLNLKSRFFNDPGVKDSSKALEENNKQLQHQNSANILPNIRIEKTTHQNHETPFLPI